MFSEFQPRLAADLEVALQHACSQLPAELSENHDVRRVIAEAILNCARQGDTRLVALTAVGRHAAMKIAAKNGPPNSIAS